jgi:hypothetical protein
MGTTWGVDSCDRADTVCAFCQGHNLAWYVTKIYFASPPPPDTINWWGRYFSPNPPCTPVDKESNIGCEVQAMRTAGVNYILPITSPGGSRTNGTYAMGISDGNAVCQAVDNTIHNDNGIYFAGSEDIIYLDVEHNQGITPAYWAGWSHAVWVFTSYIGNQPYYPGCYCNPNDSGLCSTLSGGPHGCSGLYTNQPDLGCNGTYCSSPGPGWAAVPCANITTRVWQYDEAGYCCNLNVSTGACRCFAHFPNVDLDETSPSTTETNNMLSLYQPPGC